MKNFKFILMVIVIVIIVLISILLFIKNRSQSSEIAHLSQSLHQVESEVGRLVQDNEKLQQELEYTKGAASKEKLEKENLQKKLDEIQKIAGSSEDQKVIQSEGLQQKLMNLETELKEANLNYNKELGVLYNKTKQYDKAILAFERVLESSNIDAQAHLGLAIAYEKSKKDSDSAIFHYGKYLELIPDASNKKEIEKIIERLKK